MMPKNRLKYFAVTTSCALLVPFALGGCVPVLPLIRVAVRSARQPSPDGSSSQPLDAGEQSLALMKHSKHEQAIIEAEKALALGYTDNPVFKELNLQQ